MEYGLDSASRSDGSNVSCRSIAHRRIVLLPRTAVFLRDQGPVVWVEGLLGWKERPVTLGASNRRLVEVASGLSEGARVSPVDLAAPVDTKRAAQP